MSAFVVKDQTINRAVTFLATDRDGDWLRSFIQENIGFDLSTHTGRTLLGKAMFSLNVAAVNQRYRDTDDPETMGYAYTPALASRVQAFKSMQCWQYQCSEGDIETSHLYQMMARVQGHMAEMIVTRSADYERAEW